MKGNQSIAVTFSDLGYVVETDKDGKPTYKVHDKTGLDAWADAVETNPSLNCTLTANICMDDWDTVEWSGDVGYTGTFDGGGIYTITGMDEQMFGAIGAGGKVQNLTLDHVNITLGGSSGGGIADFNYGRIANCTVTGELKAYGAQAVGGIVAHNYGTITNCHFKEGTITNDKSTAVPYIGGIAGMNGDSGKICGICTCDYTYVTRNGTTGKIESEEHRNNLTGDDGY